MAPTRSPSTGRSCTPKVLCKFPFLGVRTGLGRVCSVALRMEEVPYTFESQTVSEFSTKKKPNNVKREDKTKTTLSSSPGQSIVLFRSTISWFCLSRHNRRYHYYCPVISIYSPLLILIILLYSFSSSLRLSSPTLLLLSLSLPAPHYLLSR